MTAAPAVIRVAVSRTFNPLLATPVLVVMHGRGLAGPAPMTVVMATVVLFGVLEQPRVQHFLAGRFQGRWPSLGVSLHIVVAGWGIYLVGWGPLLPLLFAVVVIQHMAAEGSRVWRPAIYWILISIGAGQAGIALGWVYCYLSATYAQAAGALGAVLTGMVIRGLGQSAQRGERAESALRGSEERFRSLVQDSTDVICVVDRSWRTVYVSPAISRVTGFTPQEFAARSYREMIHPDDLAAADLLIQQVLDDPDGRHGLELRLRHRDSEWRWAELSVRNLLTSPAVEGLVGTFRDITERRANQQRLTHDARHDPLTGLVNRAAFLGRLHEAFAARRADRPTAVLFVDLDGFKQVNDTHGHRYGDAVLVAVADVLSIGVLGSDLVGRLGGDEFGIVLNGVDSPENAVLVAERILTAMNQRLIVVDDLELRVRASIGVAVDEPDCPDAAALLHRADVAMYSAKRHGKHGAELYVRGLEDESVPGPSLEGDLRRAVTQGELVLHYQPIVALDGGALTGVEALVRWQHPTKGLLGPLEFIPLAERTGLIDDIGIWVLERACRQVRQWQHAVPSGHTFTLNVNVSPLQLNRPALVAEVSAVLDRTGYRSSDLVLEVTEGAMINDETALPQLHGLHALGIRIALDDFGTGYSSLRYLTKLPVDILKIDRCFVTELDGTVTGSAVTTSVVRLAQIMDMVTVAEGIEDAARATELTLLGCDRGQGFYYARPLAAQAVEALIARSAPAWPSLPEAHDRHLAASEHLAT